MVEEQQTPPTSRMKQSAPNDKLTTSSDTRTLVEGSLNFGNGNGNSQAMNGLAPAEPLRHPSISSDNPTPELTNSSQWDSFAGFHWGPTSIDDEATTTTIAASTSTINSVLSVPMLPGVPSEPMYRQHRSLSFSMGQDPSIFGYDYYYDDSTDGNINNNGGRFGYKSSLETMAEEEDGHDNMGSHLLDYSTSMILEPRQRQMSFDTGSNNFSLHVRSQSSGATFGIPARSKVNVDTSYQHQILAAYHLQQQQQIQQQQITPSALMQRPSQDEWEDALQTSRRRRSSLASLWNQDGDLFSSGGTSATVETQQKTPCTPTTPYPALSPLYHPKDNYTGTSMMDHSSQRRLSQTMEYSFPENNQSYFPLTDSHQRKKSCNNGQVKRSLQHGHSSSLRGLTNQMESMHLQSEPPSPLPYSSFSTPHMRPHDYPTQQYSPSSDNVYQQGIFYHQQPIPSSSHHLLSRGYSMHPYQQAPEGFHYGPSSVAIPQQKSMDIHHRQHYYQQEEQHVMHMNYQYSSPNTDQQQMVDKLETNTTGAPHPTYSMVAASNGNLDLGVKMNINDTSFVDPRLYHENGKGVPLHRFPTHGPLYMVEFKAGRIDFYYITMIDSNGMTEPMVGDLVIVEADRGKDLGKVASIGVTCKKAMEIQQQQTTLGNTDQQQESKSLSEPTSSLSSSSLESSASSASPATEEETEETQSTSKATSEPMYVKRIYRLATPDEINMLLIKSQDEQRALVICQQKIKQRKLQMEVVDAEYQWDRRKMTFYFSAERRIDFRELVRDLFKIYKTRIWMCAVNNKKTNTITDGT